MLSKLLKYEFKSTYRTYLAVYGVMVILCSATGLLDSIGTLTQWQIPLFGIFMLLSVLFLFAAVIITTVLNLNRFYRGLFLDEGYLIHTLPVHSWQILAAKLIPAMTWTVGTGIMMLLSMTLMAVTSTAVTLDSMGAFFSAVVQSLHRLDLGDVWTVLKWCLLALLALAWVILQIYASITLGQLLPKHRVGGAVLIWFGLNLVQGWVVDLFSHIPVLSEAGSGDYLLTVGNLVLPSSSDAIVWLGAAVYLFWSVIFWTITQLLLERRLNLE